MHFAPSNWAASWRRIFHRKAMWRLAWLVMFALHLPATVKVYGAATAAGEPTAWSSLVFLAATNIFFILEICFAWSLRVLSDRRCLIVFLLIVAMLHAGVIDRVTPDAIADQGISLLLFVSTAATVVMASIVIRFARDLAAFFAVGDPGLRIARWRSRYGRSAFAVARIPRHSPYRNACAHRAPPTC